MSHPPPPGPSPDSPPPGPKAPKAGTAPTAPKPEIPPMPGDPKPGGPNKYPLPGQLCFEGNPGWFVSEWRSTDPRPEGPTIPVPAPGGPPVPKRELASAAA